MSSKAKQRYRKEQRKANKNQALSKHNEKTNANIIMITTQKNPCPLSSGSSIIPARIRAKYCSRSASVASRHSCGSIGRGLLFIFHIPFVNNCAVRVALALILGNG